VGGKGLFLILKVRDGHPVGEVAEVAIVSVDIFPVVPGEKVGELALALIDGPKIVLVERRLVPLVEGEQFDPLAALAKKQALGVMLHLAGIQC
jgi:hypothetical protein